MGTKLRIEWELEQGRTRSWLAREIGVSGSQLTRMLNGERRWTDERKARAAVALSVPVAELLRPVVACPTCGGDGALRVDHTVEICETCEGVGCVPADEVDG